MITRACVSHRSSSGSFRRSAFSLIELLVVIAIIALLVGLILPALSSARRAGKSAVCQANLRSIGQALETYSADHREVVCPSYNMTGTSGLDGPIDGWGAILERDGYFVGAGAQQLDRSPLVCPESKDIGGVASGQTGTNLDNPKGWMDWPNLRTGSGNIPQTISERDFNKILKVAYWVNANNPIGGVVDVVPDLFYTASVGYGPGTNGQFITNTRLSAFVRPHTLVAIADGVYAGRQRDNRWGITNSRIGYRHQGGSAKEGAANTVFADGHVQSISGRIFPRALGGTNNTDKVENENIHGEPTVYANPERALGL